MSRYLATRWARCRRLCSRADGPPARTAEVLLDLDASPDVLLERIAALDLTGSTVEEFYDLDVVRIHAGNRVSHLDLDIDTRLAWGELALRCVELIVATMPIDDPRFPIFLPRFTDPRSYCTREFQFREMRIRAAMVASIGPIDVRGDSRDPEAVADWFLSTVEGESPDSVLAELETPVEDMESHRRRTLRDIKMNALVVEMMIREDQLPVAPPRDVLLLEWIALRERLP